MPFKEELERQGNWLFRWRSHLPLIVLPSVLWAVYDGSRTPRETMIWDVLCIVISSLGLFMRCMVAGFVAGCSSGRNVRKQEAGTLNRTGIYSTVRHPLYLGNFFMVSGLALFTRSIPFVSMFVLAYWLYYERIIFTEEEYLREQFGKAFERWASRTPALIPSMDIFTSPDKPFSFRTVLRREYPGFFALVFSFTVIRALQTYVAERRFYLSPGWWILIGFGAIVYITLRSLKRYTRLLMVKGR